MDEIHRFNRAQQDGFLPFVEDGTITLVGATTENPSFELNAALLSRAQVLILHRLGAEALGKLLADVRAVLTVEENVATGGVGTIVAETLGDQGLTPRLRRMSLGSQFLLGSASREWAAERFGLNQPGIEAAVRQLFETTRAA